MTNAIEFIQNSISVFDLIAVLIIIYSMARCAAKGFTVSLLSFSKWLIALVITIILVPKFNPWVHNYIESKFIADIGLGIFIFIISVFVIIMFQAAGRRFGDGPDWQDRCTRLSCSRAPAASPRAAR